MTVNITINADTLELTNVDGMTRIVCNDTEKKDKPESESDWIVRRKLKPWRPLGHTIKQGMYFMRYYPSDQWRPLVVPLGGSYFDTPNNVELIGPITPDMFL
jgi:hypothetical protein